MSRTKLFLLGSWLGLVAAPCGATLATASPVSHFVDAGNARHLSARDSLAERFDMRQLPLLMAAMSEQPPDHVDPDRLYRALTRWHYYAGTHFDPGQTGLWTTGESAGNLAERHEPNMTLSTGAALELLELAALARMGQARGHVFDPLVWWNDHRELTLRLTKVLYDPVDGAYANLDSLGRRLAEPSLSGLIPVALGARHGSEATRRAAWSLWTGDPRRVEHGDLQTGLEVRNRADAFENWSADHGLHVAPAPTMAALALQALAVLDEPTLAVYARDALAARGMLFQDEITVPLAGESLTLSTDWIALRPLERSRAALRFFDGVRVFPEARADSLARLVDLAADADDSTVAAAVAGLTDLLVELRAVDVRHAAHEWTVRRAGANDLDPQDSAAFDFQWEDLHIWFDRALDLITADILAWHLRPDFSSKWDVTLNRPVVGQGDQPRLLVHCRSGLGLADFEPTPLTLMWTDGASLLSPVQVDLVQTAARDFEAAVPPLPHRNGLWQLIVEGLPSRPRISPAISIVDPVLVSIVPAGRRGATVDWAIQLRSQVQSILAGRVDLEAPLSWTGAPGTSLQYSLAPGGVEELRFSVSPDFDVSPGTYPLRWATWSKSRLIGEFQTHVDHPFSWLRIGALPITVPANPIESPYAFDRHIDLAQRVQGVSGTVAWTRLPEHQVDPDGFVRLDPAQATPGLHYAFTGFVTQSTDAILEFESEGPARVFVNGRRAVNMERWGGRRETEVQFGSGTNFVAIKLVDSEGTGARFRMRLSDIDGGPLRGVGNELEHLIENYAYLARAAHSESGTDQRQTLRLVPIRFHDPTARTVSVVGSFNGWSPSSTPMARVEDGSWQVKIRLRPGRFEYKFAVDGAEWIPDPNNPDAVADGFGGRNSVLVVD